MKRLLATILIAFSIFISMTQCENSTEPSTSNGGCSGSRTGAICEDGTRSTATGSGACSHHGGVARWTTTDCP